MHNLLNKLIKQEQEVLSQTILSPVIHDPFVIVRISGVIVRLKVHPKSFRGWGIFTSKDCKTAEFAEEASHGQKMQYLKMFPKASIIVCLKTDKEVVGRFVNDDNRFSGTAYIALGENLSLFDVVEVAFDGNNFIYVRHLLSEKQLSNEMIAHLNSDTNPDKFIAPRFFTEAYRIAYNYKQDLYKASKEGRIKDAVTRAGGVFNKLVDRGKVFTVEFTVAGQKFSPTINSETLKLENSGICLSGEDKKFDLQSFVYVAKEGIKKHSITRGEHFLEMYQRRNHIAEDDWND